MLLAPALTQAAGDEALDRATLRGLKSIGVVIDRIAPELEKQGFNSSSFQSHIEERLRAANVPVAADATEFLGLRVLPVRGNRGPVAICLSIGMYQQVTLARDPKIKTATQTWEVETVMMAQPNYVYNASLESIDELIGRFVSAWRSANPR